MHSKQFLPQNEQQKFHQNHLVQEITYLIKIRSARTWAAKFWALKLGPFKSKKQACRTINSFW